MSTVAELKDALRAKVKVINEFAAKGIKINPSGDDKTPHVEVKTEDAAYMQKVFAECEEIKDLLTWMTIGEKSGFLTDPDEAAEKSKAMQAAAFAHQMNGLGFKSIGDMFTTSDLFKDFQKSGLQKMDRAFEIGQYDITADAKGLVERKDVYGDLNAHNISLGIGTRVQMDPMVPRGQRLTRVRDLFPAAATSANLIEFFKVMGWVENVGDGNAQMVADFSGGTFGLKPKSNLQFLPDTAPVRTIAHWEAAHRNVIDDVPMLRATIDNELLYGLALVEDFQILQGDGTGENLRGILNTPGIQVYTAPNNELPADSLRRASTLAMLANYPSNGYVLHPLDWERIELQKGVTNDHYMLMTNIAVGLNARVWRQPVVETPAIDQTTFLTGAFGTAAQLYDRQQANIRISDQHADYFIRNAIAILAEERLALAVKRPEAFIRGTFDT